MRLWFVHLLALLVALLAVPAARAEVTRESPIVEETGYTLRQGEWKLGITTSSYGLTDRLQVDAALLLELFVLNAGLKYKLVDAPNLALSLNAYGGVSALPLLFGYAGGYGGLRLDATLPLDEQIALNLAGSWNLLGIGSVGQGATLQTGRISWFHVKAALQYVMNPRHIFFMTVATPTSWLAAINGGQHDFEALSFGQATFGYQYSAGIFNVRVDAGWGPSLLGTGPTLSSDFYVRF